MRFNEIRHISSLSNDDHHINDSHKLEMIRSGQMKKVRVYGIYEAYITNDDLDQNGGMLVMTDKDKNTLISFVTFKPTAPHRVSAGMVWTHPQYRKKGFARTLYDIAIDMGFGIISDIEQTRSSKQLWKNMVGRYSAYLVDKKTLKKIHRILTSSDFEKAYSSPRVKDKYLLLIGNSSSLNENRY